MTSQHNDDRKADNSVPDAVEETENAQGYRPEGIDDAFVNDAQPQVANGEPKTAVVPALGVKGWLRFLWRQLTSMRVALMLLMLLAVAALPGSLFPQRAHDLAGVNQYLMDNPKMGKILDDLSFFDVYSSPWFAAVYILLFISLIGCILPRTKVHFKALKSAPPKAPRVFKRFPAQEYRSVEGVTAEETVQRAQKHLKGKVPFLPTFRTQIAQENDKTWTVSAERGYLKETGNLLFHVSLIGVLLSFAAGQLLEYRGQAILVEGRGFANAQVSYDTFEHGAWFSEGSMDPWIVTLDEFESVFRASDSFAQDFTAHVTVETPEGQVSQDEIKVNYPLELDGAKVYLMGNGHAPTITVRDASGAVAFSGSVPFLAEDDQYTSKGVIKVPDVTTGEQLGFVGYLLPTAEITESGDMRSIYPEALNPVIVLDLYKGNLGLDDGIPQNVYRLETENLEKVTATEANPDPILLTLGSTVDLPDGLGTVEFSDIPRFAAFDLRYDPTLVYLLISSLAMLLGLALSLFTPRRRVWVRATETETGVNIAVAGLARGDDSGLVVQVSKLADSMEPTKQLNEEEKEAERLARRAV